MDLSLDYKVYEMLIRDIIRALLHFLVHRLNLKYKIKTGVGVHEVKGINKYSKSTSEWFLALIDFFSPFD